MPQEEIKKELVEVLRKHGLQNLPEELSAELQKPIVEAIGTKASYIKEIITDKSAYDERILAKVGDALKTFQK